MSVQSEDKYGSMNFFDLSESVYVISRPNIIFDRIATRFASA